MGKKIYEKLVVAQGILHGSATLSSAASIITTSFSAPSRAKRSLLLWQAVRRAGHSDSELVEIKRLQPDLREMESLEWSQPGLRWQRRRMRAAKMGRHANSSNSANTREARLTR